MHPHQPDSSFHSGIGAIISGSILVLHSSILLAVTVRQVLSLMSPCFFVQDKKKEKKGKAKSGDAKPAEASKDSDARVDQLDIRCSFCHLLTDAKHLQCSPFVTGC